MMVEEGVVQWCQGNWGHMREAVGLRNLLAAEERLAVVVPAAVDLDFVVDTGPLKLFNHKRILFSTI